MFDGISTASRLAKAVAFAEGCIDIHENYHKLSLPYRLNNPCDLKVSSSEYTHHTHPSGKLLFDSLGTGWNAGVFQMELMLTNRSHVYNNKMSIQDIANHYAKEHSTEHDQTNANDWAKNVALFLGVQTTTTLLELLHNDEKPNVYSGFPTANIHVSDSEGQTKSSFASKFKKEQ